MNELVIVKDKKKERKKMWRTIRQNWLLYVFILPLIVYYILFRYMPIYGIQIAFQDFRAGDLFGQSEWVGFKHFIRFFESSWCSTIIKNTLTLSLTALIVGFPLPIILALLLNEIQHLKFRKTVQTIMYAPHFLSNVVVCGMATMFLSPSTGLIGATVNTVREMFGLPSINILSIGSAFKWIYVFVGTWKGLGWGTIIYFAALSAVDPQLVEAAKVDGANKLQCMWHINLPTLIPTIVIQLILKAGDLLSVGQDRVLLLQNDTILRSSEVIQTYVYRVGLTGAQYSFSAAVGLFNSLVNAIMLILVNAIVRKVNESSALW